MAYRGEATAADTLGFCPECGRPVDRTDEFLARYGQLWHRRCLPHSGIARPSLRARIRNAVRALRGRYY